jgi:cysteinyl-tRNA synthetase
MIKLHNSQTRSLEEFIPRDDRLITMYVCGPTVYGPAHIGNARPAIVFDQLYRLLEYTYPESVRYARNITDIDDKIITASIERGVPISQITDTATIAYHQDLEDLCCLSPYMEPKATDYVSSMIILIHKLIDDGHAYEVDGEVFFHVPSNPHPGLANHTHWNSGARVEVNPKKKDPRDFVLWKPAKEGEPKWFSPWGHGRPGWHIECSAMIYSLYGGSTIDIHGGGQDLRFPHHDAECAQSQCVTGQPLAKYWLHNGLLTVGSEKMSKSRGNVILLRDLLDQYPGESVRYLFLQSHYRSPMDFTMEKLASAHRALDRLYNVLWRFDELNYPEAVDAPENVLEALSNDLNTTAALSALHELADDLEHGGGAPAKAKFIRGGQLLGLFNQTPHQWRTFGVDKEWVEQLISERQAARRNKDYARADEIRQQLADAGITLADGIHGTEWKKA